MDRAKLKKALEGTQMKGDDVVSLINDLSKVPEESRMAIRNKKAEIILLICRMRKRAPIFFLST